MLHFELYQKVKILYGVGAIEQLGALAASMGKQKALMVCGSGTKAAGIADKIQSILEKVGISVVTFDESTPIRL